MDRRARSSHTQHSTAYLCPEAVAIGDGPLGARGSSQVLISITTLSRDKQMGCVFSFVHGILMDALLQNTLLMASQVGKSSMFWSTSSSSSRFFSSPSPLRVLRFILSGDKFLVNLERCFRICFFCKPNNYRTRHELSFGWLR